MKDPSVFSFCF